MWGTMLRAGKLEYIGWSFQEGKFPSRSNMPQLLLCSRNPLWINKILQLQAYLEFGFISKILECLFFAHIQPHLQILQISINTSLHIVATIQPKLLWFTHWTLSFIPLTPANLPLSFPLTSVQLSVPLITILSFPISIATLKFLTLSSPGCSLILQAVLTLSISDVTAFSFLDYWCSARLYRHSSQPTKNACSNVSVF